MGKELDHFFPGVDHVTKVPLFDSFIEFLETYAQQIAFDGIAELPEDSTEHDALEQEIKEFLSYPPRIRRIILFINWMASSKDERNDALNAYVRCRLSTFPLDPKTFRRGLRVMLRKTDIRKEVALLRTFLRSD